MRVVAFALLICFFCGCGSRAETEILTTVPVVSETPSPAAVFPLVQRISTKPLTQSQQKELDESLPSTVRDVLEKADTLEVLGLSSEDLAGIGWEPDVKTELPIGNERTALLGLFFFDASAGPNPSACFIPRHGLRATYRGKTVEVIICFQCHLFSVRGDLGKHGGGVYREGSASHHLFEKLLESRRHPPERH